MRCPWTCPCIPCLLCDSMCWSQCLPAVVLAKRLISQGPAEIAVLGKVLDNLSRTVMRNLHCLLASTRTGLRPHQLAIQLLHSVPFTYQNCSCDACICCITRDALSSRRVSVPMTSLRMICALRSGGCYAECPTGSKIDSRVWQI